MFDAPLNRRHFLKGSSGALLGTLLFTSGPIALVAPSLTWALDLHHLDSALALRLMAVVKRLYPHDDMEDAVYAFAVQALDRQAGQDPALGGLLRDGLDALDRDAGGDWSSRSEAEQEALLRAIQHTAFFRQVRAQASRALYSNELAYRHFGYEGASFGKGGYLMRGFNDLRWLPAAPADASPSAT